METILTVFGSPGVLTATGVAAGVAPGVLPGVVAVGAGGLWQLAQRVAMPAARSNVRNPAGLRFCVELVFVDVGLLLPDFSEKFIGWLVCCWRLSIFSL